MLNAFKKTLKFMVYLMPPIILFSSRIALFRLPGVGNVTISRLYWLVLAALAAVLWIKSRNTFRLGGAGWYVLFFVLMIAYAALSLLWVKNEAWSFGNVFGGQFSGVMLIVALTAVITSFDDLNIFLRVMGVCYAVTVLLGIYEIFTGNFGMASSYKAYSLQNGFGLFFPYAEFDTTNDFAAYVTAFMPFAVYSAADSWKGAGGKILALAAAAGGAADGVLRQFGSLLYRA